jgi:hypothetical protein
MKALLNRWIARLPALLRSLGPYAAIELLLRAAASSHCSSGYVPAPRERRSADMNCRPRVRAPLGWFGESI